MLLASDTLCGLLLGEAPDALERALAYALSFAHAFDAHARLLRSGQRALVELARIVGPVDHVGLLARPIAREALVVAARALGLIEHRIFASRVLARELGARLGRHEVATTIFKAIGPTGVIEVFMPEAPRGIIDGWIRDGVGAHVALPLGRADDFPRAVDLLREAGFTFPPGLDATPIDNPDERVLVEYLDGMIDGARLRLELCHTRSAAR